MPRFLPKLLLLILASFLAVAAVADNFDEAIASVIVLQIKAVQMDIGVTVQQRASMNKFADAHRAKLTEYYKQLESTHGKMDEQKIENMFWEMKRQVLSQLSSSQIKRLREISLQVMDFTALADKVVGQKIGLSASQQAKVQTIVKTAEDKANGLAGSAVDKATAGFKDKKPGSQQEADTLAKEMNQRANAAGESIRPQINRIRAAARRDVMAVLTEGQRATWKELLGSPIKL
jgi:hypothetical protein